MSNKKKKVGKSSKETSESDLSVNEALNLQVVKSFVDTLMDLTLCSEVQQLKSHKIPECVWKEMEFKLKMDHKFFKKYWNHKLHLQLFCPEPIYSTDIKIKLIKFLYEKDIAEKKSINWPNIAAYFDGFTSECMYQVFTNLLSSAKKRNNSNNFKEQLQYLHDEYIPYLIENANDKILPRIRYDEGVISNVEDDLHVIASSQVVNKSLEEDE